MQAPKAKEVLCPGKMAGWLKEQLEVFWGVAMMRITDDCRDYDELRNPVGSHQA